MGDKSKIGWTDATWNPTTGCTKVSPGCKLCYAKHQEWPRLSANQKTAYYGRRFEDVQCHPERLDQPLRWTKPRLIFVNSMSDLFHESIPFEFIDQVFAVMATCPDHIFQVLTKRPARMLRYMNETTRHRRGLAGRSHMIAEQIIETDCRGHDPLVWDDPDDLANLSQWPLPNVWLGVSVENQEQADLRISLLRQCPAGVRWISAEPLLERLRLVDHVADLDWVVVGGESGRHARPCHVDWILGLLGECKMADVPCFVKQLGGFPIEDYTRACDGWPPSVDFNFTKPGFSPCLDRKGKDLSLWPKFLRVQEYPRAVA